MNGSARSKVNLGSALARMLLPPGAMVLLHGLFSLSLGLYDHLPSLDIAMHLAGGMTVAYSFGVLLDLLEAHRLIGFGHELVRAFVIASLVTSAATGWEFVEFLCDRFAGNPRPARPAGHARRHPRRDSRRPGVSDALLRAKARQVEPSVTDRRQPYIGWTPNHRATGYVGAGDGRIPLLADH